MLKKLMLTSVVAGAIATAVWSPAYARGWTFVGPHGATVTHWGGWGPHWRGPCCFGAGIAAGAVAGIAVGTAVGVAAAARPVVVPPPVAYAAPPPLVYAPGYYYAP